MCCDFHFIPLLNSILTNCKFTDLFHSLSILDFGYLKTLTPHKAKQCQDSRRSRVQCSFTLTHSFVFICRSIRTFVSAVTIWSIELLCLIELLGFEQTWLQSLVITICKLYHDPIALSQVLSSNQVKSVSNCNANCIFMV